MAAVHRSHHAETSCDHHTLAQDLGQATVPADDEGASHEALGQNAEARQGFGPRVL